MISELNRNFVCAYVVNEEYYSKDGSASPEERSELQRIQQEGSAKKLSVGMVRAYVLGPDGHTYDVVATDTVTTTLASLGRAVAQFKPQPGNPVVSRGRNRFLRPRRRML